MATRYWAGGTGTWGSSSNWSAAPALTFTASCTGTALTTTGSPALVNGMRVWANAGTSLGTITSGSGNSWVVSTGGSYASQTMSAATVNSTAPTSTDDAVFNSSSGTSSYTVTISTATCQNLTIAGPAAGTLTLAGTGAMGIYGNLTATSTGVARTTTGLVTFRATTTGKTINTGGLSFSTSSMTFSGVGGGYTLAGPLTSGQTLTLAAGALDTAGYALNCGQIVDGSVNAFTLSLGASTVTLSDARSINFSSSILTFNAGTSQITCTNSATFNGNGKTFYNVSFTSTSAGLLFMNGANTFNSLTIGSPSAGIIKTFRFSANQTIGTFSASGASSTARIFILSNELNVARTLTISTSSTTSDCDFQDIIISGAVSPISGTRLGNRKGNTGITFPASKTVYWNLAGSGTWASTAWALTDGGTPDANNFPLAQDNAIINNTSAVTDILGTTGYAVNTLTFGPITPTLSFIESLDIYGNLTFTSGITANIPGNSSFYTFSGRNTQTFTTAGINFLDGFVEVSSPGGTVNLNGNLLLTGFNYQTELQTTAGTFNANGYTVTLDCIYDYPTTSYASRGINFGSGNWTLTGNNDYSGVVYILYATNFTLTLGTGSIYCTSSTAKNFEGAGMTWPEVINAGSGILYIGASFGSTMTFTKLSNSVTPTSFSFQAGMTLTLGQFNVSGTAGNLVALTSSAPGTPFILSQSGGVVNSKYLNITDSTATGGAQWYAGTTSTNGGGNTGWQFIDVDSNFMFFF